MAAWLHGCLHAQVEVTGVTDRLKGIAESALTTKPNFAYTLQEVEADLRRVFATGWFSSVIPDAEDTRDGVKLVVKVSVPPVTGWVACNCWGACSPARYSRCVLRWLGCVTQVSANPQLKGIVARGGDRLPTREVQKAFAPLYGSTLNFVKFGK
jgi:hypothetical protein